MLPVMRRGGLEPVLWHLLAGTRGGGSRIRILQLLARQPHNLHQMARALSMDYKTVMHHVGVLVQNELVECAQAKRYGERYYLAPFAAQNRALIEKIMATAELGKD